VRYRKAGLVLLSALAGGARGQISIDTEAAFKLVNQHSGLVLGTQSASRAAVQLKDGNTAGVLWHFMPAGRDQYRIVNMWSGQVLGIAGSARASEAAVVQCADDGAADRLWQIIDGGDGGVKIKNVSSRLAIGIGGQSRARGAKAIQATDDGATDRLWKLVSAGAAYPAPNAVTGAVAVHDPSIVHAPDGSYYLFGTHSRIRMLSSPDLLHFTEAGQAFTEMPAWTAMYAKGDLWAPDVSYHNGKYWLYYAASSFGKNTSAIGLATSTTAAPGSWSDQGIVFSSQSSDNFNAIDPGLVVDASGKWWLSFGSFWGGISLIEIDPETGKQAPWNHTRYPLAHRPASPAIEAAFIFVHDRYYYLFVSFDQCCRGTQSTYHIAVGRSAGVTGPYFDRGGVAMSEGGGTILLSTHGRVAGPGGQVAMHDGGSDFLIYHYYDGNNHGARTLGINRIAWDSQKWPYIQ
jgi:arabinan endo-1,5-alpha-L-arabinosidase